MGADTYQLAVFGEPSETAPFWCNTGGHHIARNYLYEGGDISVTPDFTSIEPPSFSDTWESWHPVSTHSCCFGSAACFSWVPKWRVVRARRRGGEPALTVPHPRRRTGMRP